MKISLGFESYPYSMQSSRTRAAISARPARGGFRGYGAGKTTQDVANELEVQYKIVETFVDMEEDFIIEIMETSLAEDVEKIVASLGAISEHGISTADTDRIEQRFREALTQRRFDGVIPGVPTLSAMRGVSHLLPQPYSRRNPSRPSFVNTGLYRSAFRAWVEDLEM